MSDAAGKGQTAARPAGGPPAPRRGRPGAGLLLAGLLAALVGGCLSQPRMLPPGERYAIDRGMVEYPEGFTLERYIVHLTAPTAFAFDADENVLIAEGGVGGKDVQIIGFRPDGTKFDVYPLGHGIPIIGQVRFNLYGPIGGMVVHNGWLYVSHRDVNDLGVITALDYKGNHKTIIANLPAQGEYGVTDLRIRDGRLYFGIGTATNSSVVGLDDYDIGWPKHHPGVHDIPYRTLRLAGSRFDSPNPNASPLFGGSENAVSAPFQGFGVSNQTTIRGLLDLPDQPPPKFNGGVFSIPVEGGELRPEAHGVHYPRGLAFNPLGRLFMSNVGTEMRGSRPVKDDPDSVLWVPPTLDRKKITWYGWPDYTTHLHPVTETPFQPPQQLTLRYGYPDLSPVINREASGLDDPVLSRDELLVGSFPSQSGAAGLEYVPPTWPSDDHQQSLIVALSGDRAPFATSGQKTLGSGGFKVARLDVGGRKGEVHHFIQNTGGKPGSLLDGHADLLERPISVRFGPDGYLYVLDFGRMRMKGGREDVDGGTGKIYRLTYPRAVTQPAR